MKISARYLVAFTAALGLFPVVLDTTIVSVALIPISRALKTDLNTVQWIVTGYLLANSAALSLSGYLGNLFGVKRLFLGGVALFGIGSALCGIAPDENWLIAFRVFQGIGGGIMLPLGQSIALEPFAENERAKAFAIVGVPLLLAPVLGPIVGGLIVDNWDWQYLFFVNLPLVLLVLPLGWKVLPADKPSREGRGRFDYLGLLLATLGIVAVVYGFKLVTQTDPSTVSATNPQGSLYGWGYWQVWAYIGTGIVLLTGFGIKALWFSRDPVLDLRLFKRYDFTISNLISWLNVMVTFGILLLMPVFFQQVRLPHMTALETGLAMVPLGLATLVGTVLGGGLFERVGPRILVVIGTLMFVVSAWQLSSLTPTTSGGDVWLWLAMTGLGVTLTGIPVQTLALKKLKGEMLAKGSSLAVCTRFVFASLGAAVLTTLFVQQTTSHADALKAQFLKSLPAGALANPNSPQVLQAREQLAAQAGTAGINDVFTLLIFGAILVALVALALPGRARATGIEASDKTEESGSHSVASL